MTLLHYLTAVKITHHFDAYFVNTAGIRPLTAEKARWARGVMLIYIIIYDYLPRLSRAVMRLYRCA